MFDGWLMGLWITGLVLRVLCDFIEIVKIILKIDEEIYYEMSVHKKRYEASYLQIPDPELIDTLAIQQKVENILLQEYTKEQIENPNEQLKEDMQNIAQNAAYRMALDIMEKKFVWFMISENYGRFYITMFYDNEYNHSDGEDL